MERKTVAVNCFIFCLSFVKKSFSCFISNWKIVCGLEMNVL